MASQSSTIGFFLIAGFIVYVTVRGELPAYLCVIGFGSNCGTPNPIPNTVSTMQTAPPNTTSIINTPTQSSGGTVPIVNTGITSPIGDTGDPFGDLPPLPGIGPIGSSDSTITFPTDNTGGGGGAIDTTIASLGSGYQINPYCEDEFGDVVSCG